MMQGKFPGAVLMLEMPADLVDVNVHPAKTEIRFARESDVFDAVYRAVRMALTTPGSGECRFEMSQEAPAGRPASPERAAARPATPENIPVCHSFSGRIPGAEPLDGPGPGPSAAGNRVGGVPGSPLSGFFGCAGQNDRNLLSSHNGTTGDGAGYSAGPAGRKARIRRCRTEEPGDHSECGSPPGTAGASRAAAGAADDAGIERFTPGTGTAGADHHGAPCAAASSSGGGSVLKPTLSPSGKGNCASLTSMPPTSAFCLRSWPRITAMYRRRCCWCRCRSI